MVSSVYMSLILTCIKSVGSRSANCIITRLQVVRSYPGGSCRRPVSSQVFLDRIGRLRGLNIGSHMGYKPLKEYLQCQRQ